MGLDSQYLGNPNLTKAFTPQEFTKEQILEFQKCMNDPQYFVENYIKIVSLDKGLVPFDMYPFQKEMIGTFHNNRFVICKLPRQSGKTTTMVSYMLHYVLFNENMNVAILANKASTARDILSRLQLAYEHLPKWLQQGILSWNKGSLELENGSRIVAASTSSSAIRGGSYNMIFLDEFAFVPTNIAEEFFSSVYPTISSGESTKIIIVSTPNGMNMYYKMWTDAESKKNTYIPIEVHWSEVPGRDEKWKQETIANTSEAQFQKEFECEFLGSSNTLINPAKIKTIPLRTPIKSSAGLDIYDKPKKDHTYVIVADVARGVQGDASAFIVIDVSQLPHRLVGKYKNNEIKPMLFPNIIKDVAVAYNNAFVMVEVNDVGDQVANSLQFDLEYDNLIMASMRGRAGQIVGGGFSGGKSQLGVRTTKAVKKIGCSNLKTMVESDKIILEDFDIISEMSSFVLHGQSYQAEEGHNDDLIMCCVLFAWLSGQTYFKELTDTDVRAKLFEESQNQLEQDLAPFGFVDNGLDDPIPDIDEYGTTWTPVIRKYDTDW